MKDKVPLQRVDQIAGGRGTDIAGMGGARENSSIGAAWRGKDRAEKLDRQLRGLPDSEKDKKINVLLTLNGKSVD